MLSSWDCLIFVLYNLVFYSTCSKSQKQPNRLVEHNNALLNLLPNAAPLSWDPGTVQDLLEHILFVLDVIIWKDDNGHEGKHLFSRNISAGCGAQTILRHHHTSTCLDPSWHILLHHGVGEMAIQRSRWLKNFVHRWQESTIFTQPSQDSGRSVYGLSHF